MSSMSLRPLGKGFTNRGRAKPPLGDVMRGYVELILARAHAEPNFMTPAGAEVPIFDDDGPGGG